MTFDEIINAANSSGFRLMTLFQLQSYPAHANIRPVAAGWQAQFRTFYPNEPLGGIGTGATADEALIAAYGKCVDPHPISTVRRSAASPHMLNVDPFS